MNGMDLNAVESRLFTDRRCLGKLSDISMYLFYRKFPADDIIQKPVRNRGWPYRHLPYDAWDADSPEASGKLGKYFCPIGMDSFCHWLCRLDKV